MKNGDTAVTLIGLVLGSALAIYLFKWTGVISVVLIVAYEWFSPPPKRRTSAEHVVNVWETGCGIIILFFMVLLLAHLCGC